MVEAIGLIAGFCTTSAFCPQVIKAWKTRSVEDLSLVTYCLFCVGLLLWIVYGMKINSIAVMLTNTVSLFLAVTILIMKIMFKSS